MKERMEIRGRYEGTVTRHVSRNWEQVCADHEEEFPTIRDCFPGTFNIRLELPYVPPEDARYRCMARERGKAVSRYEDGNHISPRARVVALNGTQLEAWIYRGGHPPEMLDLLSRQQLAQVLGVHDGDEVAVDIEEIPETTPGMPGPPPRKAGQTVGTA